MKANIRSDHRDVLRRRCKFGRELDRAMSGYESYRKPVQLMSEASSWLRLERAERLSTGRMDGGRADSQSNCPGGAGLIQIEVRPLGHKFNSTDLIPFTSSIPHIH